MEDKIYSVMIAEDELPARELLIDYLMTRPEFRLSGIAKNGEDALKIISACKCDLLLLDIQLPVLTGIEVLERLENIPHVIFTTAYDRYALKAFEFGAVDYLLKPFSLERFNQSADRFLAAVSKGQRKKTAYDIGLSFKEGGRHYLVSYGEIIYLSSHAKRTVIHTEGRDFETAGILKDIEKKLPENLFVRIHKQYVANLMHVSNLEHIIGGQYIAYMKDRDESPLPVGRSFAPSLKNRMRI
jgi:DNA-binding LytR/AlgR family response regulator